MARETAKQRREREDIENALIVAEEIKNYPAQMMDALHRASNHEGFDISINKDHKFIVKWEDEWKDRTMVYLPLEIDASTPNGVYMASFPLNELTRALDRKDELLAEEKRKAEIRKNAIAKLTDEERLELGIGKY